MKFIVWAIFASLLTLPTALSARDSIETKHGQLPLAGPSEFKPQNVVVKITKRHIDPKESLKHGGLAVAFNTGTGYCLGKGQCSLILTNYHVAERVGTPLSVNGVKVLQTYEATSAQDKGAVWVKTAQGIPFKLVQIRDIAIFRMARPLKNKDGIQLSPEKLHEGESVKVYGFPGGKKLTTFAAAYLGQTKEGMLVFKTRPEDQKFLIPGMSGSLVVNEKNEAVGLVNYGGNTVIQAVPVWSLAEFVKKSQPNRYSEIFLASNDKEIVRPDRSEIAPVDVVPESLATNADIDPESGTSPPPALPEEYLSFDLDKPTPYLMPEVTGDHVRAEEPPNVQALRKHAEEMLDRINDLIAVATERYEGGRSPEITMQYRLRMVSGQQTFTMDGKELTERPCPKGTGINLGSEWSDFATMVGSNPKLRIQQARDLTLEGWGSVKVFRYEGTAEDNVKKINYCTDWGLGILTGKLISVPVRGEVWTDDALNILRITLDLLAPPDLGWIGLRTAILYGWLETQSGERELVPTNLFSRGELTDDHQVYSTACRITDYRRFTVNIVVGNQSGRGAI